MQTLYSNFWSFFFEMHLILNPLHLLLVFYLRKASDAQPFGNILVDDIEKLMVFTRYTDLLSSIFQTRVIQLLFATSFF